jgi:tripartite-type tricarboxylate transporter receptor subunit TctC
MKASLFALAALVAVAPSAEAADPYFKGRTVTILVGYAAGGPQDLTARLFAQYYPKHLAGAPNVIVSNMVGASAIRAHNTIAEVAKGDGETIMWTPWQPVAQLLESPGVRFKYQDFQLVGMFRIPGVFVYARNDNIPGGIKSGADIVKMNNIKFGGGSAMAGYDMHATLSFKLFGKPYTHVTGYRGSADQRSAIMKNEINTTADVGTTISAVLDDTLFKPGIAKPLYSFPYLAENGQWMKDSTMASFPSVIEIYREVHGKDPSGPTWDALALVMKFYSLMQMIAAPPSTPKAIVEEMRAAYVATLNDPTFRADYAKRFAFAPEPAPHAVVQRTVASLGSVEPRLVTLLREHVEAKTTDKPTQ